MGQGKRNMDVKNDSEKIFRNMVSLKLIKSDDEVIKELKNQIKLLEGKLLCQQNQ